MRAALFLLSPLLLCLLAAAAVAQTAPACQPPADVSQAALNALRARARHCGSQVWPAAPALSVSPVLSASAQRYAEELARRDRIDHVGEAGLSLRARLREAGYALRVAGENLAGGPETLDEALAQWLSSPGHCENLMGEGFREFGLACATGPGQYQRYWVLHLAAPVAGAPAVRSSPDQSP